MAILSKLRSSSGSKLQKKKSSFLSNLKKFILCSSSCEDDKADVDNQFPDPPSDIEDDNVSIISLGDGISQLKIEGSGIQSESSKSGSETSGSSASNLRRVSAASSLFISTRETGGAANPIPPPIIPVPSDTVPAKRTLPPIDPAYTKKAKSLLDKALHGESSGSGQSFSNTEHTTVNQPKLNDDDTSQKDEHKKIGRGPILIPKLESVQSLSNTEHTTVNQPKLNDDDTSRKDEHKKMCRGPILIPKLEVAEAPITHEQVSFKPSCSKSVGQSSSSPQITTFPKPILKKATSQKRIFPEPEIQVTKRVSFALAPAVKLISPRKTTLSFPAPSHPSPFACQISHAHGSGSGIDLIAGENSQPRIERPCGAHHLRVRSRTMNVQEYIPYDQDRQESSDSDSDEEEEQQRTIQHTRSRPLTRRVIFH